MTMTTARKNDRRRGRKAPLSVSRNSTRSKKGFVAVWLRHAPAPLLWIHPIAKKYVLMPDGDSNVLFCSQGISSGRRVSAA